MTTTTSAAPLSGMARLFRWRDTVLQRVLGSFTTDQWFHKVGTSSHSYWLVAHLTYCRRILARKAGVNVAEEAWEKSFGKGSKPPEDKVEGLEPADLLKKIHEAGEAFARRLDVLTDADLAADSPREWPIGGKSLRDMFLFMDFHESYHTGQLGLIARSLGKDVFG
jgi:uncharacterized damage-inducible protein DinB